MAVTAFQSARIDLAVLDVMMPGRTGFAVCREIKSAPGGRLLPVVIMTALARTEDRIQGIECGADEFLPKPIAREELIAKVRSLIRLKQYTDGLEEAETVLFSLALSVEAKDSYTAGHCERISHYASALGKRVGLDDELLVALRRGGFVHDIGKISVPDSILLKPGLLTPGERQVMQMHTVVGERICAPLKSFQFVRPIIRHHHERLDGSGYPDGLKGEAIPLTARILTTVDIYDALTTDRPYRKGVCHEEAFEQIRNEVRQGWWDGDLVDEFEALLTSLETDGNLQQGALVG
jgi:putative two-component system response regulator